MMGQGKNITNLRHAKADKRKPGDSFWNMGGNPHPTRNKERAEHVMMTLHQRILGTMPEAEKRTSSNRQGEATSGSGPKYKTLGGLFG